MSAKPTPKVRSAETLALPPVTEFPADPLVRLPSDDSDDATLKWCDDMRDEFEAKGQFLTLDGLLKTAETCGLSDPDTKALKRQITDLFGAESKKSAKPKSPKKPKEKTVTTATMTKPKTKAKTKAAKPAAKKGKAAKPTNGHGGDSKLVFDKTVRGVAVQVYKSDSGRQRAIAGGVPFRKLMQWCGKQGWLTGEAKAAFSTLLKDYKGGDKYVADLIQEGHVGSGAKADKKGMTVFGALPDVPGPLASAMKQLKK